MRRHRTIPLRLDPGYRALDRLICNRHVMRVCMQQHLSINANRHMAFPKQKIAALKTAGSRLPHILLQVAIPRTVHAAGVVCDLHET